MSTEAPGVVVLSGQGKAHDNAGRISTHDALWGIYGVTKALVQSAESDDVDMRQGLAMAAHALACIVVDRIGHGLEEDAEPQVQS